MDQKNKDENGHISVSRTIQAKNYISSMGNSRRGRFIFVILALLEKYFGSPLLCVPPEIPSPLGHSMKTISNLKNLANLQRCGVINKIYFLKQPPDEPYMHIAVTENGTEYVGSSENFFEPENALDRAVGEAVERYGWASEDFLKREILVKTQEEIEKIGKAVSLSSLAGFSREQRRQNQSLEYNTRTKLGWVKGFSLTSKKNIWVPAQLVNEAYFSKHHQSPLTPRDTSKEPLIRWCVTTGMAAGKTKEAAILSGILEIIERDAFMITYLNKISPPTVDLGHLASKNAKFNEILLRFKRYSLEPKLINLPTDFPVTVLLSILIDSTEKGPRIVVGLAAGFNPEEVATKALGESLKIYRFVRKNFKVGTFENFEISHLAQSSRLIYWAQKKDTKDIEFLLRGPIKKIGTEKNPKNAVQILTDTCIKKGYELCYVDTTPTTLTKSEWSVIRTIIPQLQPMNLLEYIPYHGGERLESVPKALGYIPTKDLNKEPHPFS